jgi:hypothetical protein
MQSDSADIPLFGGKGPEIHARIYAAIGQPAGERVFHLKEGFVLPVSRWPTCWTRIDRIDLPVLISEDTASHRIDPDLAPDAGVTHRACQS